MGCSVLALTVAPTFAALALWNPSGWEGWMVWGFLIGAAQFASVAGWTTSRLRKAAVKTMLGVGLGLIAYGLSQTPWPLPGRVAFLVSLAVVAAIVQLPRAHRIRRMAADEASG